MTKPWMRGLLLAIGLVGVAAIVIYFGYDIVQARTHTHLDPDLADYKSTTRDTSRAKIFFSFIAALSGLATKLVFKTWAFVRTRRLVASWRKAIAHGFFHLMHPGFVLLYIVVIFAGEDATSWYYQDPLFSSTVTGITGISIVAFGLANARWYRRNYFGIAGRPDEPAPTAK